MKLDMTYCTTKECKKRDTCLRAGTHTCERVSYSDFLCDDTYEYYIEMM